MIHRKRKRTGTIALRIFGKKLEVDFDVKKGINNKL